MSFEKILFTSNNNKVNKAFLITIGVQVLSRRLIRLWRKVKACPENSWGSSSREIQVQENN